MADQDVLNVEKRETRGTARARRMRREGKIPAILYGHGKECVALTLKASELSHALRHNAKLVELKGGASETAIFKHVQWDTFFQNVLHVDLARTDADEKVEMELPVEVRGSAPGSKMGGTVEQVLRDITILCPASSIPESLELSVNELQLDQTLTAADVPLPNGASLVTEANTPIVTCTEAVDTEEEDEAAQASGAEPEVVGQKDEDKGGDS